MITRTHHRGDDISPRAHAMQLADLLPPLPAPWDVSALCQDLADQRGRKITVHSVAIPAFPTGLWYFDGTQDHILVRASARGIYRDHIILHEICHMLAGHGVRADVSALADHNGQTCSDAEEVLAEQFASVVLRRAQHRSTPVGALEQSATYFFGVPSA